MTEIKKVKQPFVRALRLLEKARAEIKRTGHADYCASWGNSLCDCDWPELEKELDDFILSQWKEESNDYEVVWITSYLFAGATCQGREGG